ncbi:hypothetical protein LENED_007715 [Lentinula edodes]|uniref:Uncharacterized protein n=1 Tax=Lentinula edodes TaxID=5353 RepID=A0A1Q3EF79_LENED|nr:hypothetical protein LENED_007715 [Lentinula edodes]
MLLATVRLYASLFLGILYLATTLAVPVNVNSQGDLGINAGNHCWSPKVTNRAHFNYYKEGSPVPASRETLKDIIQVILDSFASIARSKNREQPEYDFIVIPGTNSLGKLQSSSYKIPITFGPNQGRYLATIDWVNEEDGWSKEDRIHALSGKLEEMGDCARTLMVFKKGMAQARSWKEGAESFNMMLKTSTKRD